MLKWSYSQGIGLKWESSSSVQQEEVFSFPPVTKTQNTWGAKTQVVHRTIQESGWTRVDKATAQTFYHQEVSPISLLAPAEALYVMMHDTVGQVGN